MARDSRGAVRFRIEEPFALDATGRRGEVSTVVRGERWTFVLDPEFAASAVYPVTLDPTVSGGASAPLPAPANVRRTQKLAGPSLAMAYFDGSQIVFETAAAPYDVWTAAPVVVGAALSDFSVVSDAADGLSFAFRAADKSLRFVSATRTGGVWAVGSPVTVDAGETYAPNIARAADGTLAVSYERYTAGVIDEVKVATSATGSSWAAETVSSVGWTRRPVCRCSSGPISVWCTTRAATWRGGAVRLRAGRGARQRRWARWRRTGSPWRTTPSGRSCIWRGRIARLPARSVTAVSPRAAGGARPRRWRLPPVTRWWSVGRCCRRTGPRRGCSSPASGARSSRSCCTAACRAPHGRVRSVG